MYTSEKSEFIAESLAKVLNHNTADFKKLNKKLIKSAAENMNYSNIANLIKQVFIDSIKIIEEWEDTNYLQLDDLTPNQYFKSLNTINELVELLTLMESKDVRILPAGLVDRIRKLDDVYISELFKILQSMDLGKSKCFDSTQKSIIRIVEALALPQFINALLQIISQLDDEKSDEDTVEILIDAINAIGEPALEPLINLVENGGQKGTLYTYLIFTIGKIASGNKSDRIYRLLKDCFRKSENKVIEVLALSTYGDGRAIPAIRGHIEKNLEDLSLEEYAQFREAVLLLGGDMSDFDEYFDDYGDYDEFDGYDNYDGYDELDE